MTVLTFSNDMAIRARVNLPKAAAQPLLDPPKHTIAYVEEVIANPAFGFARQFGEPAPAWFGILPNTAIKIVAKACLGVPFAIQLAGGAQFSLRRDELAKIKVPWGVTILSLFNRC